MSLSQRLLLQWEWVGAEGRVGEAGQAEAEAEVQVGEGLAEKQW